MKISNFIKYICYTILIIFVFSYVITNSGYYEYNLNNRKVLTNNQIKEFEKDVSEGKDIDINSYLNKTNIDYSNKLTKTTSNISIRLNEYLKEVLMGSFRVMEKLVK